MSRRVAPPVIDGGVPEQFWDLPELPPSNRSKRTKRPKIDPRVRARVYARDDYRCVDCGTTSDLTIDHVIPLARGGRNHESNMATRCEPCNSAKADLPPPPKQKRKMPKRPSESRVTQAYRTLLGESSD